jgi:DNA modification methylase
MYIELQQEIVDPKDLRLNQLQVEDRAFHDWYRFVLSFPPHLVREYLQKFDLDENAVVLDPFCGTGTTLVEAKKMRFISLGVEAHPMMHFASKVKTNWNVNIDDLISHAHLVYETCSRMNNRKDILLHFNDEQKSILLKNSISPIPLHKCLLLYNEIIKCTDQKLREFELLALADICVRSASNLKFGPEVGISRKMKEDAPAFEDWINKMLVMAEDLYHVEYFNIYSDCYLNDSRAISRILPENAVDAVITSPPYPNEKDYTRTTRLESVLLKFVNNKNELRALKQNLLRSNTRNVYKKDDDDIYVGDNGKIRKISEEIERRRIALNKTSGFERLYHRVAKLYFGGMKRHLEELKVILKPGAKLAYVVGDQASYLQVLIRTGELLAEIADSIGYNVLNIDLFRTRLSTATKEQLREEVVILEWNGETTMNSKTKKTNRYDRLIERVFFKHYKEGSSEVFFDREEFKSIADEIGIALPLNLGDIIYSYRYRNELPASITELLGEGEEWIIRSVGRGKYVFARSPIHKITPNPKLSRIKILDSTPEIIRRYALNDEQALLAIIRYNRLIDIFTGVACYSLQNHLRTSVKNIGQVETDELYVGVNRIGKQFIFPVQAKGRNDQLGVVQIEQDFAVCDSKFPNLKCRPIAAQFIEEDLIALFEFEKINDEITIKEEKHYKIVPN